jgi:hypothetical protein
VACPKFEASLKLDPGLGAILNLADCYEKNGQTASAWAEFREASAAARASGSKDREDLARQRAAALEPKLSRLTIVVGKQSAQVTRDGTSVDSAAFGTAMPVDPGKHVIEATATTASSGGPSETTVRSPCPTASMSIRRPDNTGMTRSLPTSDAWNKELPPIDRSGPGVTLQHFYGCIAVRFDGSICGSKQVVARRATRPRGPS